MGKYNNKKRKNEIGGRRKEKIVEDREE